MSGKRLTSKDYEKKRKHHQKKADEYARKRDERKKEEEHIGFHVPWKKKSK